MSDGTAIDPYVAFLREKVPTARASGFTVEPQEINPALKPHTRDIVQWACAGGRRAVFASFGLHKTATQLEWHRRVGQHRPGLRLITLPLGVRQEFVREAALWAAAGLMDTLLRWKIEPEVVYGNEAAFQPRVQG